MHISIHRLHRFLLNEAFYPLVLASLVAGIVFAVRVYLSHSFNYSNLVWNLILAWIPYLISLFAAALRSGVRQTAQAWLLLVPFACAWLLFFPNAPYIVTDFYHLQLRYPIPLWFDIGLICLYAFTGCFLAVASLRTMQALFRPMVGRFLSWVGVTVAIGVSAVGVYLGRFGRWNSWDFLTSPKTILKEIAQPALAPRQNLGFVGFTLLFTALLFILYLMFVSFSQRVEEEIHQ